MLLAWRELGTGAPVVLLHGLFGQARNFGALQAQLAQSYRTVAMDLRNHGASPHMPGMDYPALAADVLQTLDALGIDACAVIGHSMGGKVAMRLALDAPDRVSALVVADIAPRRYRGSFAAFTAAMQALELRPGLTRAQADAALAAAVPDADVRAFLLQNLNAGAAPSWRIGLAEIASGLDRILDWSASDAVFDGPALFISGERSNYVTEACHPDILRMFPRAAFSVVAGAGHWVHADNPVAFLGTVRAFLERARQEDEAP